MTRHIDSDRPPLALAPEIAGTPNAWVGPRSGFSAEPPSSDAPLVVATTAVETDQVILAPPRQPASEWISTLRETPGWLLSMAAHMVLIILLALAPLAISRDEFVEVSLGVDNPTRDAPEDVIPLDWDEALEPIESEIHEPTDVPPVPNEPVLDASLGTADDLVATEAPNLADENQRAANTTFERFVPATSHGAALSGRGRLTGRKLQAAGGNEASEAAVERALWWLAAHQSSDGSWSFDHRAAGTCRGQCGNPGSHSDAKFAATGLALLPFLGAGHTHERGRYKQVVARGLYYLATKMKVDQDGTGSLHQPQGRMYGHGIASIAICEAYAMTGDRELRKPAQRVIDFIVRAQHVGGGWRYEERQRGDTSIVGWQIMALTSGHLSYLKIPRSTVQKAKEYLDYVQYDRGARYGYSAPNSGSDATTAIGLLCRMYMGTDRYDPGLERGIKLLSRTGPSKGNMYYNYYATQAMHHWGGTLWKKWNNVMRDYLVGAQETRGHARGSWHFQGDHGSYPGGRLYSTAMAAMILEVYYRHLPIYASGKSQKALGG
jgi:hypothetical protein